MVGVRGLEPPASASQTLRATDCATPRSRGPAGSIGSRIAARQTEDGFFCVETDAAGWFAWKLLIRIFKDPVHVRFSRLKRNLQRLAEHGLERGEARC